MLRDLCYNLLANIRNRRVNGSETAAGKSIKLIVVHHFDCELPKVFSNRDIYVPLWCGRREHASEASGLCDNRGDNISTYNAYLNEATGIYWAAKHYGELGNPDFIGINHYRRHLQWQLGFLAPGTIVCTSQVFYQKNRDLVCFHLNRANRDKLLTKICGDLKRDGHADFEDYLNSHTLYAYNMFIMDKATFFRYFAFIETYLRRAIELIDSKFLPLENAPAIEKRIYGYMAEHLTSYWIYHERCTRSSKVITTCVDNFDVSPR